MRLCNLLTEQVHCSLLECYQQAWKHESVWRGYQHAPRPANGLIFVCTDMKMRFELQDGRCMTAQKGDIVFLPEGVRYTVFFLEPSNQVDSYTINFRLVDDGARPLLLEEDTQIFRGRVDQTLILAAEDLFASYLCIGSNRIRALSQFYRLLDLALERMQYSTQGYYPIKKGVELLTSEWRENRKIEYYAEKCGIDPSYFYRLFRQWAGCTPNEYRARMRVAAAKDLLTRTNLSVAQIAQRVGFEDPYYFSRFFKKELGLSPAHYRHGAPPEVPEPQKG